MGQSRRGLAWVGMTGAAAAPLFALWIAITDSTRPLDLVAGGVCALLAGAGAEAAGVLGRVAFRPQPSWMLRALAAPWWVLRDSALVLGALLRHLLLRRPLEGRMVVVPFATGGEDGRAVARRALAYGAGSAGPNLYVVDGEDDVLVCHELVATDGNAPLWVVGEADSA